MERARTWARDARGFMIANMLYFLPCRYIVHFCANVLDKI